MQWFRSSSREQTGQYTEAFAVREITSSEGAGQDSVAILADIPRLSPVSIGPQVIAHSDDAAKQRHSERACASTVMANLK